jgi:hypothetical protein
MGQGLRPGEVEAEVVVQPRPEDPEAAADHVRDRDRRQHDQTGGQRLPGAGRGALIGLGSRSVAADPAGQYETQRTEEQERRQGSPPVAWQPDRCGRHADEGREPNAGRQPAPSADATQATDEMTC